MTERSARSLNRFLPAVEMTNHELLQVGTAISTSGKMTVFVIAAQENMA